MTTPVWTELVCAVCASASIGRFSSNGRIEVNKLKTEAMSRSWFFKYNKCFCCRLCLKKYEDSDGQV